MAATTIREAHHLIESAPDEDVKRLSNESALSDRIFEWLETPEGTVADLPGWGNNLIAFKHDPDSPYLPIQMEMAIAAKLPKDIADLVMLGVSVKFIEIDLCRIVILHQFGNTTKELTL